MTRLGLARLGLGFALVLVGCQGGQGVGDILTTVTQVTMGADADLRGAAVDLDEPEEIELGRAVTAMLGSRYKLLRDESLTRYIALVGNAVALQSERPDLRYYFAVLDTDEVNAFAAPGGYVFITRGTLGLLRDEAMLSGVLGHEIGHIALRHHNETIKAEKKTALAKTGGRMLVQTGVGFIQGTAGTVTSAIASSPVLNVMADAAGNLVLKGFSRSEERQADAVGFKYAVRAGYDPAGLRDFLKAVQEGGNQPATSSLLAKFVATHPGADERLREQDTQLKNAPATGRRAAARFREAIAQAPKK